MNNERLKSPEEWKAEAAKGCGRNAGTDDRENDSEPCPECILQMVAAIQAETYAVGFEDGFEIGDMSLSWLGSNDMLEERIEAYERRKPE